MNDSELARFEDKYVVRDDECWEWTAARHRKGYGRMTYRGKVRWAHRLSYEHYVGPIPDGLQIDHLCRNKWCVNPEHLEAVTNTENARRAWAVLPRRIVCIRGHLVAGDNLYITKRGCASCRECQRISARASGKRLRALRGARPAPADRTHCAKGHAYDEANTIIELYDGRAHRRCRKCRDASNAISNGRRSEERRRQREAMACAS